MGFYGDNLPSAVAEQLRAEKAALQLSFDELAERSGVGRRTLIRYFNGEREIPIDALAEIADALGVSPRDILGRAIERIQHR